MLVAATARGHCLSPLRLHAAMVLLALGGQSGGAAEKTLNLRSGGLLISPYVGPPVKHHRLEKHYGKVAI